MIQAYVGLPGTGKTYALVMDAIPLIKEGIQKNYTVYSNFPIKWREKHKGKTFEYHSICLNPVDFMDALEYISPAVFLVDEANIIFSSYDWKNIERGMLNRFAQGRKLGLDFYYTSQRYGHSLKRLRDLTNYVIQCKKMNIFGLTFFRHIYYNPLIFDRENLFDTPLENKYILKKRFIWPHQLRYIYTKYDTNFIVESKDYYLHKHKIEEKPPEFII